MGNHERMTAARAHQIGLVSEVVADADALADAAGFVASAIASAPPTAIQATLRTLWAGRELTRQQALALGNPLLGLGMSGISELPGIYAQAQAKLLRFYDAVGGKGPLVEKSLVLTREDALRRDVIADLLCNLRVDYPRIERRHDHSTLRPGAARWSRARDAAAARTAGAPEEHSMPYPRYC
jgi:coproporphyrinogen III oxidase-like Fe-S oxidoreductase